MAPLADPDRLKAYLDAVTNCRDALAKGVSTNYVQMKQPRDAAPAFPWRCNHCGENAVDMATIQYQAEVRHDGRLYTFTIPNLRIPVCRECGEKVFTEDVQPADQRRAPITSSRPCRRPCFPLAVKILRRNAWKQILQ